MLAPRALNTTKNPVNFCSTYLSPVPNWHEVIGDPTIADAICDRIIHNAHRIVTRLQY